MKNKMKNILALCGIFAIAAGLFAFGTTEGKTEVEEVVVKVKIIKDVNGETTVIDTTIVCDGNFNVQSFLAEHHIDCDEICGDNCFIMQCAGDIDVNATGTSCTGAMSMMSFGGEDMTEEQKEKLMAKLKLKLESGDFGNGKTLCMTKEVDDEGNVKIKKMCAKAKLSCNGEAGKNASYKTKVIKMEGEDGEMQVSVIQFDGENISDEDRKIMKECLKKMEAGQCGAMLKKICALNKENCSASIKCCKDNKECKWLSGGDFANHEVFIEIKGDKDKKVIVISKTKESSDTESKMNSTELINDLELKQLSFYPNPNNGKFNLSFMPSKEDDTQIQVTDIQGKVLYNEKVSKGSESYLNQLDISTHGNGIFFLNITQGAKKLTRKIVVK